MRSQSSYSDIAQERMIPAAGLKTKNKQKAQYISFQDAQELQAQKNIHKDHFQCKCQNVEWSIENQEVRLADLGIKIYNSKLWMIDKVVNTCCKEMLLDMKVLVRRNSKFEICRVHGTPDNEQGIKYVLEGYGMTVKLSIILVKEGKEKIWKEIELPENTLTQEIQYNFVINERPNSTIRVNFNEFFFAFNISQPSSSQSKICFKGTFQINNLKMKTSQYTETEDRQAGCSLISCRLF